MPSANVNSMNGRTAFWILTIAAFLVFFSLFSDICFPFLVGFSLAYCFIPCVDSLSKYMNRALVSLIMTVMLILVFVVAALELLPRLKEYIFLVVNNIREYSADISALANEAVSSLHIDQSDVANFEQEVHQFLDKKVYILASIVGQIASRGDRISSFLSFFIVMPISFFYFLRDWDRMANLVYNRLPFADRATYTEVTRIIRRTLSNFLHGQFFVVVFLSIFYSSCLWIIGVENYGVLGVVSGLFSFIPLIGAMFSLVLVIFISVPILTIPRIYGLILVYTVGQFIEGYIFYPKFVGKKTGLHPLWIIFSFFAGIKLQGIVGVLISIPSAAIIRSLIGFAVGKFMVTQSYKR